jgi:hypothetical protein
MSKRVLGIGLPPHQCDLAQASFLSRRHFSEFDLVIWDPLSLHDEASGFCSARGQSVDRVVSRTVAADLISDLKQRRDELFDICKNGKDLIIILRKLRTITYEVSYENHSEIDLNDYSFLSSLKSLDRYGDHAEWKGPHGVAEALPALLKNISYSAVCSPKDKLSVLYQVAGSAAVVGAYAKLEFGSLLIFVPHSRSWGTARVDESGLNERTAYLEALIKLPAALRGALEKRTDQPMWAKSFVLPAERQALEDLEAFSIQAAAITAQIRERQAIVDAEQLWKRLFTTYDDALVEAVIEGLLALGIRAVRGPKSHADIIACHAEKLAVLEVKGKTSSASRSNAQQCITWVSELTMALVSDAEQRLRDPVTQAYLAGC